MGDLQDLQEDLEDFAYSALHGLSGLAISLSLSGQRFNSVRGLFIHTPLARRFEDDDDDDEDGFLVTLFFADCVFLLFSPLFHRRGF